ncbi:MAG: prepilin-type N-terminal cleavage/methylation domain-containing protein [Fidelibacterota bacterium]
MWKSKGFTLFELIITVAIMSILIAIIIPETPDVEEKAHKAKVEYFIAKLKVAVELKAIESISEEGIKHYPRGSDILSLDDFLSGDLQNWSYENVDVNRSDFFYMGDKNFPGGVQFSYVSRGQDSYRIVLLTTAYGWDAYHQF